MKKTATFLMLCLLAMVALVSCDKEEEGYFHTIQIAERSSNMAAMEQISSFVTNYTTAYSSQLGYIAKPHAEAQADFEQFCSHLKYKVEEYAKKILAMGIHTVDSFDIHTDVPALRHTLNEVAKAHGTVSIISAGWDPGSDSVVRTLLEAIAPKGITYTNFGPGMSMGHTVAVKAVDGVKAALSMTIPVGTGIHRRMVYIELEDGYAFDQVAAAWAMAST